MTPADPSVDPAGPTAAWPQTLDRLVDATALALGFATATLSVLERTADGGRRIAVRRRSASPDRRADGSDGADEVDGFDDTVLELGCPTVRTRVGSDGPAVSVTAWPPTGGGGPVWADALGVPVSTPDGSVLGVLSSTDDVARPVDAPAVRLLEELARLAAGLIVLARDSDDPTLLDDDTRAVARAVENGQIVPWYQPVIELASGQVVGFEALARWPGGRPDGHTNAAFIEIAERSDLVIALDHAVVAHALADLGRWRHHHPALRLSVNLSGRHLGHEDWLDVIDQAAAQHGVPTSAVDLELTETVGPSSTAAVADARSRGYRVLLDDFGSGWSGLHELVHTPVDGIKLDLSFARGLGTHTDDAVIGALTTAAEELGLRVTIEGIETEEQAVRARALGCHLAQGYLWSPAVPVDDLEDLLVTLDAGSAAQGRYA